MEKKVKRIRKPGVEVIESLHKLADDRESRGLPRENTYKPLSYKLNTLHAPFKNNRSNPYLAQYDLLLCALHKLAVSIGCDPILRHDMVKNLNHRLFIPGSLYYVEKPNHIPDDVFEHYIKTIPELDETKNKYKKCHDGVYLLYVNIHHRFAVATSLLL